jgi:tRNA A37 threonylcarbamoyltransferase TsaD
MVTRWPDEFERARQLIDEATAKHIGKWAKILGLSPPIGPRIDQFCEDVTEAMHACMQAHIAGSAIKTLRRRCARPFLRATVRGSQR